MVIYKTYILGQSNQRCLKMLIFFQLRKHLVFFNIFCIFCPKCGAHGGITDIPIQLFVQTACRPIQTHMEVIYYGKMYRHMKRPLYDGQVYFHFWSKKVNVKLLHWPSSVSTISHKWWYTLHIVVYVDCR